MTTLRRRIAATAMIALVPTLAACGFDVQTNQPYQAAAGVDSTTNKANVVIRNAVIVIANQGDAQGYFVGSFINDSTPNPAKGTDGVTATVTSVTVAGQASATPAITLAPNAAYNPQPLGAAGNQPIPLAIPTSVTDGGYVKVTFVISGQADIVLNVPVFLANTKHGLYQKYVPASEIAPMTEPTTEPTTGESHATH